jgi:hypothetical protein
MDAEQNAQHHLRLVRYQSIIGAPLHLILAMWIEAATSKLALRANAFATEIGMHNFSRRSRLGTKVGSR